MANPDIDPVFTPQMAEDNHMRPEDFTDPSSFKDSNGDPLSDSRLIEAMEAARRDFEEDMING